MVRRSRRTTLGVASFGLSSPWILSSSRTNSRFLSASSAFAFSIPATIATGQKRGRVISGGIESAGAGVSGMTASHGRRQRFDCEVHAPDDEEEIVWRGVGTRKRLSATRCGPGPPRGSQASPRLAAFVPLSFSKDERFRSSSAHGADAHARVTVQHFPGLANPALPFHRGRYSSTGLCNANDPKLPAASVHVKLSVARRSGRLASRRRGQPHRHEAIS